MTLGMGIGILRASIAASYLSVVDRGSGSFVANFLILTEKLPPILGKSVSME